ncbi:MAG TPA: hydrogenase maturation protease [Candidatus Bathyarchaeia archaeon]|nr:hydrogenase maturation protease [Candidatus Bathyarchaeia archaeon]
MTRKVLVVYSEVKHCKREAHDSSREDGMSVESSESWRVRLAELMTRQNDGRAVVVVGIGHEFKGDDYVGSLVAKDLQRRRKTGRQVVIVDAESSPENITKVLSENRPRLLILIDAIDAGLPSGSISLMEVSDTTYPFFGTHSLPLRILLEMSPEIPKTVLLGIQSASHEFGMPLSSEVAMAESQVVMELGSLIEKLRG